MDSEVFARIRDYLADQLEVEPEKITPDSDIVNDFVGERQSPRQGRAPANSCRFPAVR